MFIQKVFDSYMPMSASEWMSSLGPIKSWQVMGDPHFCVVIVELPDPEPEDGENGEAEG